MHQSHRLNSHYSNSTYRRWLIYQKNIRLNWCIIEQRLIWSLPVSPNRVFIGKSFRSRHLFFWCLFLQVLFQLFYQSEFLSLWESQTPMIILSLNALTNYFKVPIHGWKRDHGTQIFRLLRLIASTYILIITVVQCLTALDIAKMLNFQFLPSIDSQDLSQNRFHLSKEPVAGKVSRCVVTGRNQILNLSLQ